MYLNELEYMLSLDRATAIIFSNKMIVYNNIAIVETLKESMFMYVLKIFVHLGFNIDKIINCDVNIVIYKKRKQKKKKLNKKISVVFSDANKNICMVV